ncbi:ATP-binding cassette domain-containing protein [Marinoscillum sp.]|uniref:ATP-binding cassette domain-containing protein n=1 Tax=Marinoscillum sp. TaxID=2024838 RepID=UPI003BAA5252
MSLLEIDSVNFSYGEQVILSNIYLRVEQGEVVGFLGRNGCGKSTLLKVIFGTLRGDSQSVRIGGSYLPRAYQSGKVKFLPQEGLFPGFLQAKEAAQLYQADLDQLLADEQVSEYFQFRFDQMSSGLAKYIETLIILYSPAEFILLDEPFSFVAPVLVEKLIPIIRTVAHSKGVLMTDHQYQSILNGSDRLYLLRNQCLYPISGEETLKDMGYIN